MSTTSLASHISNTLGLEVGSPEFLKVFGFTVRYLAHGYGKGGIKAYHTDLASVVDFTDVGKSAADFRIELSFVSRFVVNIRYFALAVAHSDSPSAYVQAAWPKYGLCRLDAVLVWNTYIKQPMNRSILRKEILARTPDFDVSMVTPQAMHLRQAQANPILDELAPSIRNRTNKQLRWITKAHNVTMEDLRCEIVCQILQSYYQSLPNSCSPQHHLNYLRRSLENRINNLNNKFGADKRQRMFSTGDGGYEIRFLSENQMGRGADGEVQSYENMLGEEARTTEMDTVEHSLSLDELLSRTQGTKRGKLYSAISGRHPEDLTQWLRDQGQIKADGCALTWLARKSHKVICRTLGQWLNVSVNSILVGLNRFAGSLGYA